MRIFRAVGNRKKNMFHNEVERTCAVCNKLTQSFPCYVICKVTHLALFLSSFHFSLCKVEQLAPFSQHLLLFISSTYIYTYPSCPHSGQFLTLETLLCMLFFSGQEHLSPPFPQGNTANPSYHQMIIINNID